MSIGLFNISLFLQCSFLGCTLLLLYDDSSFFFSFIEVLYKFLVVWTGYEALIFLSHSSSSTWFYKISSLIYFIHISFVFHVFLLSPYDLHFLYLYLPNCITQLPSQYLFSFNSPSTIFFFKITNTKGNFCCL